MNRFEKPLESVDGLLIRFTNGKSMYRNVITNEMQ